MDRRNSRRPSVTIHYAQTLDGRIATSTGNSQWVSGEESLQLAHQLRAAHQAVLVGVGTVLADNPRLTVRLAPGRSPSRIVADCLLRSPLESHILSDGAADTLLAVTSDAPADRVRAAQGAGAEVLVVDRDKAGHVDLADLFHRLADLGIESVLIEGGQGVITSALRARLVDRLVVCIAPKVVGTGIEAIGELGIRCLDDAVTFTKTSFTTLGRDIIFDGQLDASLVRRD